MRVGKLYGGRKDVFACAAGMALLAALHGAHAAEEFQPERLKDGVAFPADMIRMYVPDFSIGHLSDGRVSVVDARTGRYVGIVDAGYAGHFALSPDGKEGYIAATYLSRHTHGKREDVLEIYDMATLRMKGDVILPTKHAQALPTHELLRPSHDGRYVYVQNATPATSVTVVDVQERKVLAEVPTPGCWAIYPSQTQTLRFSMLCGDGTASTVTLNADGSIGNRSVSKKFFDSDKEPVYVTAADDGASYYFLSFYGKLTRLDLSGDTPVIGEARELVPARQVKQGWRPGGYQLMALHRASGRLFIGMHPKGAEGTHKTPAKEIWVVDLKSGKLLERRKSNHALVLSVNQGAPGYLYETDATTNRVHAYDLNKKLRQVYVTEPMGDAPLALETP